MTIPYFKIGSQFLHVFPSRFFPVAQDTWQLHQEVFSQLTMLQLQQDTLWNAHPIHFSMELLQEGLQVWVW